MNSYQIETTGRKHLRNTIICLLALGYNYHSRTNIDDIMSNYSNYPYLAVYPEKKELSGNVSLKTSAISNATLITLDELLKLDSSIISVKLNEVYTAEVSNNGIKVGCTTFPLEIVNKLVEAIKTIGYSPK